MADINVQMPSEDEDFDATATAEQAAANTEATPAVSETPDFSKPEEVAAQAPTTPEAPVSAETVPEAPVAPVTEAPAPVVAKAPKAPLKLPVWQIATAVLALAVIALAAFSFSLMSSKKEVETKLAAANANPQLLVQKQTDDLIKAVGKLMTLPAGETPTVANVSDAAKAKQQSAFFNNAQNGDRVLMYVKAGEAILYRPSTNKVILVAPLTFNNAATTK